MKRRISLRAGGFYESKCGEVWCCYRIDRSASIQSAARCVRVSDGRLEYFFEDGRYDEGGRREHTLVREVATTTPTQHHQQGDR